MEQPGRIHLAPGVSVAAGALAWSASCSGGPGGQHVNKTATKAELRVPLAEVTGLRPDAIERLIALAGERVVGGDELQLTCDETRSLRRNRDLVLERLRALVLAAQVRPKVRRATRPSRGSVERRLKAKAHRSDVKRGRRDEE